MIIERKTFNTSRDMKEAWGLSLPQIPVGAR